MMVHAVPCTSNKPTAMPDNAAEIMAPPKTILSENIMDMQPTKVPNPIFIKNPGAAIADSLFVLIDIC